MTLPWLLSKQYCVAIIVIPLILRKVPRNVVYGFRTRLTLENDFVWYETNAYFGRVLFISSFVSALLIVFFYFSSLVPERSFLKASIAVLVIPPMVAVLLTIRYMRSIT